MSIVVIVWRGYIVTLLVMESQVLAYNAYESGWPKALWEAPPLAGQPRWGPEQK